MQYWIRQFQFLPESARMERQDRNTDYEPDAACDLRRRSQSAPDCAAKKKSSERQEHIGNKPTRMTRDLSKPELSDDRQIHTHES